jgi:hypothetical protein
MMLIATTRWNRIRNGACALTLGAALSAQVRAEEPAPRSLRLIPVQGTRIARAFTLEHDLVLERMAFVAQGTEQVSLIQLAVRSTFETRVKDQLRSVEAEKLRMFERRFESASLHVELEESAGDQKRTDVIDAVSPLSGTVVRFTWVDSENDYGRLYTENEASEEFLARLQADMDFAALFPKAPVKLGESWTIAPHDMVGVFAPGGEIPLRFTQGLDNIFVRTLAMGVAGPMVPVFDAVTTGKVSAKFTEVRKDGEQELAVIALELELENNCDQRELARTNRSRGELLDGSDIGSASLLWTLEATGELLVDLGSGTPKSLNLKGPERFIAKVQTLAREGSELSRQELRLGGELRLRMMFVKGGGK